jgi:hypothetical protein
MRAYISEDGLTIKLPVPFGTPMFIIESNQHDGMYPAVIVYDWAYINREVYPTLPIVNQVISNAIPLVKQQQAERLRQAILNTDKLRRG